MKGAASDVEWYRELQFIAAVPMPDDLADSYGVTVNGMWADPEQRSNLYIEGAHSKGCRVLFSVPLIALTPRVYSVPERRYLLDEACRDIEGNPSLVPWYYWESRPVYSICFYSDRFRHYLMERCREGIERGMDGVNLDEINTSIGLMNRDPGGSGFCASCLSRFRRHVQETAGMDPALAEMDDSSLRERLRTDDALYERYRRFHQVEAYHTVADFVKGLRHIAQSRNPHFAVTANVAYLGNVVPEHGDLWGPMWGELIDFVMMENVYEPERGQGHLVLPRGKFIAWYRLGSAFSSRAPAWICPSIMVPKQMAGEKRTVYYTLMFVEAYVNNGRWGYYWWPGVDVEARLEATAPEQLKDYTRLLAQHRTYFESMRTRNALAILYLNSSMRIRPEAHFKYVALAQALAEAGYQYDVLYGGDGTYSPDALDLEQLCRYEVVLLPEAGYVTPSQSGALAEYVSGRGGSLVQFVPNLAQPTLPVGAAYEEGVLYRYWKEYRDEDRERIVACVRPTADPADAPIHTSHPLVNVTRYVRDSVTALHFINYDYDAESDQVTPVHDLVVRVPWEGTTPVVRWITLDGERDCSSRLADGELTLEVPRLDLYGLAVLAETS